MAERTATAIWSGNLTEGSGTVSSGTGVLSDQKVTWAARTEDPAGMTSPEELIAAAHASCYAMAFSNVLNGNGTPPERLEVTAKVGFGPKPEGGMKVTYSKLSVKGRLPGLDAEAFQRLAREGEAGCPVSNALRNNVDIELNAELEQ
jgi:osmotically inducible protein OsmC